MTGKYFYSFLFQCFLHLDVSLDQYGGLFLLIIWEDTSKKKHREKETLMRWCLFEGLIVERNALRTRSHLYSCLAVQFTGFSWGRNAPAMFYSFVSKYFFVFFVFPFTSLAGPLSCLGNHNRIQRCYQRSVPRFLFIISPQITPQAHKDNFKLVPP